jgi:hypothetical protein
MSKQVRPRINHPGATTKLCTECGITLVAEANWSKAQVNRLRYICRQCEAARVRHWRLNRSEPVAGLPKNLVQHNNPVKVCKDCRTELILRENWAETRAKQRYYICNPCESAHIQAIARQRKTALMEKYGGVCACCGETRIEFLSIDHINGGGKYERESLNPSAFYRKLRREPKREDLRVLCMNCNHSIGLYGYCPHEREQVMEEP